VFTARYELGLYRGANVFTEWREFPSAPCLAGEKRNLMIARVSMLLKSHTCLSCFRACFLPGRAKDLSSPREIRQIRFRP